MSDYLEIYANDPAACGPLPFPEVASFLDALPTHRKLRILDAGCGQGRDALYAARLGHSVVGVDIAANGVAQMLEVARVERLSVKGTAADLTHYAPVHTFDVVLCDRVLHCLPDPDQRVRVLVRLADAVLPGGYLFVVEPPSGAALVQDCLESSRRWSIQSLRRGFLLSQATR